MKTKKTLVLALGLAVGLFACKKQDQVSDPDIGNNPGSTIKGDAVALKQFFKDNENTVKQSFSVDAANPALITTNGGMTVQFYANPFETQSGGAVTGNVDIEITEILNKADMLLMDKAPMGKDYLGNITPLVSGGEFKILASQNGQKLKLKQYNGFSVTVPAMGGTVDPAMTLFYGDSTTDTVVWNQADSAQFRGNGGNYDFFSDSLGWINCDYFYSDPRPKTYVDVEIPAGFTNNTCKLFVWFDGMNSITSFYNYSSSVYTSAPSYQLPVGLNVHFVAISIIGGNPHVAIIPATIGNNHYETISALTQTTAAQFAADLSALP